MDCLCTLRIFYCCCLWSSLQCTQHIITLSSYPFVLFLPFVINYSSTSYVQYLTLLLSGFGLLRMIMQRFQVSYSTHFIVLAKFMELICTYRQHQPSEACCHPYICTTLIPCNPRAWAYISGKSHGITIKYI